MTIPTEPYLAQRSRWPASGRHILAQFDEQTIIVYQAYSPAIGHYAVQHGCRGKCLCADGMQPAQKRPEEWSEIWTGDFIFEN